MTSSLLYILLFIAVARSKTGFVAAESVENVTGKNRNVADSEMTGTIAPDTKEAASSRANSIASNLGTTTTHTTKTNPVLDQKFRDASNSTTHTMATQTEWTDAPNEKPTASISGFSINSNTQGMTSPESAYDLGSDSSSDLGSNSSNDYTMQWTNMPTDVPPNRFGLNTDAPMRPESITNARLPTKVSEESTELSDELTDLSKEPAAANAPTTTYGSSSDSGSDSSNDYTMQWTNMPTDVPPNRFGLNTDAPMRPESITNARLPTKVSEESTELSDELTDLSKEPAAANAPTTTYGSSSDSGSDSGSDSSNDYTMQWTNLPTEVPPNRFGLNTDAPMRPESITNARLPTKVSEESTELSDELTDLSKEPAAANAPTTTYGSSSDSGSDSGSDSSNDYTMQWTNMPTEVPPNRFGLNTDAPMRPESITNARLPTKVSEESTELSDELTDLSKEPAAANAPTTTYGSSSDSGSDSGSDSSNDYTMQWTNLPTDVPPNRFGLNTDAPMRPESITNARLPTKVSEESTELSDELTDLSKEPAAANAPTTTYGSSSDSGSDSGSDSSNDYTMQWTNMPTDVSPNRFGLNTDAPMRPESITNARLPTKVSEESTELSDELTDLSKEPAAANAPTTTYGSSSDSGSDSGSDSSNDYTMQWTNLPTDVSPNRFGLNTDAPMRPESITNARLPTKVSEESTELSDELTDLSKEPAAANAPTTTYGSSSDSGSDSGSDSSNDYTMQWTNMPTDVSPNRFGLNTDAPMRPESITNARLPTKVSEESTELSDELTDLSKEPAAANAPTTTYGSSSDSGSDSGSDSSNDYTMQWTNMPTDVSPNRFGLNTDAPMRPESITNARLPTKVSEESTELSDELTDLSKEPAAANAPTTTYGSSSDSGSDSGSDSSNDYTMQWTNLPTEVPPNRFGLNTDAPMRPESITNARLPTKVSEESTELSDELTDLSKEPAAANAPTTTYGSSSDSGSDSGSDSSNDYTMQWTNMPTDVPPNRFGLNTDAPMRPESITNARLPTKVSEESTELSDELTDLSKEPAAANAPTTTYGSSSDSGSDSGSDSSNDYTMQWTNMPTDVSPNRFGLNTDAPMRPESITNARLPTKVSEESTELSDELTDLSKEPAAANAPTTTYGSSSDSGSDSGSDSSNDYTMQWTNMPTDVPPNRFGLNTDAPMRPESITNARLPTKVSEESTELSDELTDLSKEPAAANAPTTTYGSSSDSGSDSGSDSSNDYTMQWTNMPTDVSPNRFGLNTDAPMRPESITNARLPTKVSEESTELSDELTDLSKEPAAANAPTTTYGSSSDSGSDSGSDSSNDYTMQWTNLPTDVPPNRFGLNTDAPMRPESITNARLPTKVSEESTELSDELTDLSKEPAAANAPTTTYGSSSDSGSDSSNDYTMQWTNMPTDVSPNRFGLNTDAPMRPESITNARLPTKVSEESTELSDELTDLSKEPAAANAPTTTYGSSSDSGSDSGSDSSNDYTMQWTNLPTDVSPNRFGLNTDAPMRPESITNARLPTKVSEESTELSDELTDLSKEPAAANAPTTTYGSSSDSGSDSGSDSSNDYTMQWTNMPTDVSPNRFGLNTDAPMRPESITNARLPTKVSEESTELSDELTDLSKEPAAANAPTTTYGSSSDSGSDSSNDYTMQWTNLPTEVPPNRFGLNTDAPMRPESITNARLPTKVSEESTELSDELTDLSKEPAAANAPTTTYGSSSDSGSDSGSDSSNDYTMQWTNMPTDVSPNRFGLNTDAPMRPESITNARLPTKVSEESTELSDELTDLSKEPAAANAPTTTYGSSSDSGSDSGSDSSNDYTMQWTNMPTDVSPNRFGLNTDAPMRPESITNARLPTKVSEESTELSDELTDLSKEPAAANAPTTTYGSSSDSGSDSSNDYTTQWTNLPTEVPPNRFGLNTDAPMRPESITNARLPTKVSEESTELSDELTDLSKEPAAANAPTTTYGSSSDSGSDSSNDYTTQWTNMPTEVPPNRFGLNTDAPMRPESITNARLPTKVSEESTELSDELTDLSKEPAAANAPTTTYGSSSDSGSDSGSDLSNDYTMQWTNLPTEVPPNRFGLNTDAPMRPESITNARLPTKVSEESTELSDELTDLSKEPAAANAPTTTYGSSSDSGSDSGSDSSNDYTMQWTNMPTEVPPNRFGLNSEPTLVSTPTLWSPPPVQRNSKMKMLSPAELSGLSISASPTGYSFSDSSSQSSESSEVSLNAEEDAMTSPPPVKNIPRTETRPTITAPPSKSKRMSVVADLEDDDTTASASAGSSTSDASDTIYSLPPLTSAHMQITAPTKSSPTTKSSGASAVAESSPSLEPTAPSGSSPNESSSDVDLLSPAPVTRAPALTKNSAETYDDGNDVLQTVQTSLETSSSRSAVPSPASVIRSPMVKGVETVKMHTGLGSSDDEANKNTNNNDDMILLGDTGSLIIYSDGSKVSTFEKYDRGDGVLKAGQVLKDGISSYNNIIVGGGNRSNLPPGAAISLSSTSQKIHNTLLYASYALGVISTVLLMFFHLLALQRPPWLSGSPDSGDQGGGNGRASMGWLTPNVWEFAVVVGYIQHVNSISMLELTKAPQIVLDFTDSFSFANLHLSSVTTTAVSEASRRLQLVILTGIVAFSDRIGVDEDKALINTVWFFLAALAILVVLFSLAAGFTFYHHVSVNTWAMFSKALRSSFAMCVVGLSVAMWVISVFPLVAMSSYELVMELRYRVGIGLAVALFSLWAVVAGGLCFAFVSVRAIPMRDAFHFKHFTVWGSLYGDSKMVFRYFFVVTVVFQALLGVITGAVSGVPAQLVSLMVTHLLFVVVALIIRPFAACWVLGVVVSFRVVAIANLLCSFAFLTSSELSIHSRGIVAQTFVTFNAIVFILLFARYVAMFVLALKHWSGYTRRESFDLSRESYELEESLASLHNDETPMVLTNNARDHRRLNDGGSFITSGAEFASSQNPEYSSAYFEQYATTPAYCSGQRYVPTPAGSSAHFSNSGTRRYSRGVPSYY
ncbi:unnamed protein product [Peronospora belbahrii]|uniref:TRP C-terminal domain-containing protein n=1 Tax=Peronospora belbahrii TaxID=622444 RepID=A0AAU9LCH8_9STRA|nr:unnamed protein product [Peronospora belbahrii]